MEAAIFCSQCGTGLKPETRFCTHCGATTERPRPADELRWEFNLPLLTNRFVLMDTVTWMTISLSIIGLIFISIFAWHGGWTGALMGLTFTAGMGVFLLVITLFSFLVIFGNRWPLEYVINDRRVVMYSTSRRARAINRAAVIVPVLAGRPTMAGAGLIAQAQEVVCIRWSEVRIVRRVPDACMIYVRSGPISKMRIFCQPDQYEAIARRVEALARKNSPSVSIT